MQTKRIKTGLQNVQLKIDLGRTIYKNPLGERLISYTYKFAKFVIETSSKVWKPKTYNKIVNDLIYGKR